MAQRPHAPVYLTVEQFEKYDLPEPYTRAELVRGELRLIPPTGFRHGSVGARLGSRLVAFVEANRLGVVTVSNGYVLLDLPRTVRAPDIAFVARASLSAEFDAARIPRFKPDLAVEILSPSETRARLEEKLDDYRAAGIPLVWVVDPERETVTVIEGERDFGVLGPGDLLEGGALLPGFSCPVGELFAPIT